METVRKSQRFIDFVYKLLFTLEYLYKVLKSFIASIFIELMVLISFVFIRTLVLLIILYIGAFIVIAIANLLTELNIYYFNAKNYLPIPLFNYNISLDFLLYMAGVFAFLLLGILLMGIFRAENGIVILPFEVDPRNEKLNGKVISEMLITELKRINRIHVDGQYSKSMWRLGEINLAEIQPNEEIREKFALPQINPQINPEGESLTKNIETLGTFGFGSTSLPIGNIILLLKQICPGTDPGLIVAGCLRKNGADVYLDAYMKSKNSSWSLRQEKKQSQGIPYEDLVADLSFQIAFEQLKSNRNVRARIQDLHIGNNDFGIAVKNERPSNWKVFKHFTEAKEALQKYNQTKEKEELDSAKMYALKAASAQPYFNSPLYLLFYVGIAYLNLEKNDDAEKLARYIVTLRPDSALAWYSWGFTLCFLSYDQEAIKCYDKALELKDSVEEHKMKADIYFMKARSLRNIKRYDEAIKYL